MSAQEPPRPIRILADHSRDAHSSSALAALEPDDRYHSTRCWEPVTAELLKDYDVLAICGQSRAPYTDEELEAIKAFVEEGGGLSLAANAGAFEAGTLQAAAEMSANQVAALFGAEFLSPQAAQGKTNLAQSLIRGYEQEDAVLVPHAVFGSIDAFPLAHGSPLSLSGDAEPVIKHKDTDEPIAAVLTFGEGRVFVMGDSTLGAGCHLLCGAICDWLAEGRHASRSEMDTVPDAIGGLGGRKKIGEILYTYDPGLEDQCDRIAELVDRVVDHLKPLLGKSLKRPKIVGIKRSCGKSPLFTRWWHDNWPLGAEAHDAAIIRSVAEKAWVRSLWDTGIGEGMDAIFTRSSGLFVSLAAQEALGYPEVAQRLRQELLTRASEAPDDCDVTRAYDHHPKGFWVARALHDKCGDDLFQKLFKALPEKDVAKGLPIPFVTPADIVIYYLSLAAEEDLFPWFAETGATVHPVPLVPKDSDDFASAMRDCAEQGLRDPEFATSDRVDALEALAIMNRPRQEDKSDSDEEKEQEEKPPPATDRLKHEDPYGRLLAGFELATRNDPRGFDALRELTAEEDGALQAMAALILTRCGDDSVGQQLLELAPRQDARFALDAGCALQKLGFEGWERLSLEELAMADGTKPGGLEINYDGCRIDVFPTVDGYKVANVMYCIPEAAHFPHNIHVSCLEVGWVHTDPRYRRKNMARLAMARVLEHKAARHCSCTELGTGTRNVAHTLYRSFGFTDVAVGEHWTHSLDTEPSCPMPEGVSLRSYRAGDERALAELARESAGASQFGAIRRAAPPPPDHIVKIAERDGEMVGAVTCAMYGEEAWVEDIWLKEPKSEDEPDEDKQDDRPEIGAALLGRVHAELREFGAKKVGCGWSRGPHGVRPALATAGYRPQKPGGVWMWGLLDLPKLLKEITALLERRLADSDYKGWTGSIDLLGDRHRARLTFTEGKVSIESPERAAPGLALTCDDDTLTRVIRGVETPFEAYLQLRLTIQPQVNEQITKLLETIFPSCALS